jgi:NADP-dependent 3-hydroxy acid dehydrogenase YdfG
VRVDLHATATIETSDKTNHDIIRSSLLEKQFKTNVVGMLDVTNAALPHLQARKSGTIVMMGSRSAYRTEIPVSAH